MTTAFAVPANNLTCIVGPGGYTLGSGTLTLAAGQGANFPALSGSQFYRITVIQAAYAYSPAATLSNLTIFRASSLTTDTFGSVLAIEGTTDRNYAAGDAVDVRVTAGTINDIQTAINDIQTAITNIQTPSQAVMGSSYSITSSGVWQSTGFSLALPAAGTYLVFYNVRVWMGTSTTNQDFFILVKLVQTDTSSDVTNSQRIPLYVSNALALSLNGGTIQLQNAYSTLVTVASACNVTLYAQRASSGSPTWTTSNIQSDGSGWTTMMYMRVL